MSFTVRVLVGLVAGLLLGVAVSVSQASWLLAAPGIVEPANTSAEERLDTVVRTARSSRTGAAAEGLAHRGDRHRIQADGVGGRG